MNDTYPLCIVTLPVYAMCMSMPPSRHACRKTGVGEKGTIVRRVDHQTYIVRFGSGAWAAPVHESAIVVTRAGTVPSDGWLR